MPLPGTENKAWARLQASADGSTVVASAYLTSVYVSQNGGRFILDGTYGTEIGLTSDGMTLYALDPNAAELNHVCRHFFFSSSFLLSLKQHFSYPLTYIHQSSPARPLGPLQRPENAVRLHRRTSSRMW